MISAPRLSGACPLSAGLARGLRSIAAVQEPHGECRQYAENQLPRDQFPVHRSLRSVDPGSLVIGQLGYWSDRHFRPTPRSYREGPGVEKWPGFGGNPGRPATYAESVHSTPARGTTSGASIRHPSLAGARASRGSGDHILRRLTRPSRWRVGLVYSYGTPSRIGGCTPNHLYGTNENRLSMKSSACSLW